MMLVLGDGTSIFGNIMGQREPQECSGVARMQSRCEEGAELTALLPVFDEDRPQPCNIKIEMHEGS
jgi:hypothetical protein